MQAEVTRLAPSPTGALHLGNARTFLVNWALARQRGWRIVLRIEDLDTPRVKQGVLDLTIDLLRWLGLDWDEGPLVQSHDSAPYREAAGRLAEAGCIYPCELSRTEVLAAAGAPQEGSGEVRFPAALRPADMPRAFRDESGAWRFATPADEVEFEDRVAGTQRVRPAETIGDFVVWTRRDAAHPGQPAYQLAVVVDDHRRGVTQIVRGDDLIDSAARQLLLIRALGYAPAPTYWHLPLVRGGDGRRLAKRHGDSRLDTYRARGVSPERVIGLAAWWCGMRPGSAPRAMSGGEFLAAFDVSTMPRTPVVFTAEDDAWLLAKG